jgi:Protein of unknown function (DUF3025)
LHRASEPSLKQRLAAIDWQWPWLAALRHIGEDAAAQVQAGAPVAQALNTPGAPRHFVPQLALPEGEPYEAFIARTGQVPTRENLHDFFNGLIWRAQPALKARLNQLQATAIVREGIGSTRGPLRDALTLFDENGALLQAPPVLIEALRQRDWRRLFITERAAWREAQLTLVGHALLEQLCTAPRKGLTAHVFLGDALGADEAQWRGKPFAPLPVLGVPLWWAANEEAHFYDDASVFRAPRPRPEHTTETRLPRPARGHSPATGH